MTLDQEAPHARGHMVVDRAYESLRAQRLRTSASGWQSCGTAPASALHASIGSRPEIAAGRSFVSSRPADLIWPQRGRGAIYRTFGLPAAATRSPSSPAARDDPRPSPHRVSRCGKALATETLILSAFLLGKAKPNPLRPGPRADIKVEPHTPGPPPPEG